MGCLWSVLAGTRCCFIGLRVLICRFGPEAELDVIAGELNDRPRKTLDWDMPRECFGVLLAA